MSTIEVKFDDKEIKQMLNAITVSLGGDMSGLMKNIGIYVVDETKKRFDDQKDPDGQPWEPLKPETLKAKKTNKILIEQGKTHGLQASINYTAAKQSVTIGANKDYAAIHQFGGVIKPRKKKALSWVGHGGKRFIAKNITIPARPYMGINKENETVIMDIILAYMESKGV